MKSHFELCSWFHAPGSQEALKSGAGTVTFVPNMLHRAATDRMHAKRPNIFFGTCTPPDVPSLPVIEPNATDRAIGNSVAELVDDRATIQLGIGTIPNAAALALGGKHDLGVHTEMMVDSMLDLYEAGVITNKYKTVYKDKFVCTFAMGIDEVVRLA